MTEAQASVLLVFAFISTASILVLVWASIMNLVLLLEVKLHLATIKSVFVGLESNVGDLIHREIFKDFLRTDGRDEFDQEIPISADGTSGSDGFDGRR